MYRGEVNVAHDKLPQLLNAAEALQVKGLAGPNPSSQVKYNPFINVFVSPIKISHEAKIEFLTESKATATRSAIEAISISVSSSSSFRDQRETFRFRSVYTV